MSKRNFFNKTISEIGAPTLTKSFKMCAKINGYYSLRYKTRASINNLYIIKEFIPRY